MADPDLRRLETKNFYGVEYDIFAHVHELSNVILGYGAGRQDVP